MGSIASASRRPYPRARGSEPAPRWSRWRSSATGGGTSSPSSPSRAKARISPFAWPRVSAAPLLPKRTYRALLDRKRAFHAGLLVGVHAAVEGVRPGLHALQVEGCRRAGYDLRASELLIALGLDAHVVSKRLVRIVEVDRHVSGLGAQGLRVERDLAWIGGELDRRAGGTASASAGRRGCGCPATATGFGRRAAGR